MIECNVNNITKYFGADLIFEQISFDIKTNERIGLIGPNGCGKTTVLKIIYGLENADKGDVTFRKGTKLGYLHQIPDFDNDAIVIDILESAFEDIYKQKKVLDESAHLLGQLTGDKLERELNRYTKLSEQYEMMGGYDTETRIKQVSTGLKLPEEMLSMDFSVLSGGEKTRVMLAKILLEEPSILMLDEPSNHLDLESIEWLENYLKGYNGSVIIVSHDRYFLDNVCSKIIELSTHKAHVFHGNYSYYVIERERRFLLELKVYLAQERQIKRMEEQIKRYRIWGEMRDSDKMFKRAKELERRLSKIEKLDKPKHGSDKMKLKNISTTRSGKRVLEAYHISKSFDELELLEDTHLELIFKDRLAILGKNGSGKTTLLKQLLDDVNQEESKYKWGSKIKIGYLAQEVKFDNESQSVLDYFMNEHNINQNSARAELAKALFIRDDVYKRINHLSGGEKSKLKLCSLTFEQVNFMILDEPTNHLDIDSREILEEMLLDFKGTILFVSHDRYFIKKIGTRIAEINDKKLDFYEGDYDYYKHMKLLKNTN
jgi:ATPase subunit of ABC transporter with duplicated ATPase domains